MNDLLYYFFVIMTVVNLGLIGISLVDGGFIWSNRTRRMGMLLMIISNVLLGFILFHKHL